MAFLRPEDHNTLREYFRAFSNPVRVTVFSKPESQLYVPGQQAGTSADAQALIGELAELTEAIRLEIVNIEEAPELAHAWGIIEAPTITVSAEPSGPEHAEASPTSSPNGAPRVHFVGLPAGYEFTSLLETLKSASADGGELQAETLEKLSNLQTDIEIKTFITPT